MTVICFCMLASLAQDLMIIIEIYKTKNRLYWCLFIALIIQPALLLIGFFPSNKGDDDNFILGVHHFNNPTKPKWVTSKKKKKLFIIFLLLKYIFRKIGLSEGFLFFSKKKK